ncbi:MAG: tRNA (guanosine(46)-N7)-methyltransferase TrmB, partial [Phaeodactylibacter sp.]|nr:tRNA (guanosine(46)-N7)-methyltransferase TrmB [Phaeodactylibacter sp.]
PGGLIHLKTDEPNFFSFTLEALAKYPGAEILHQDEDIYSKPLPIPELELKTYYERIHLQEGKAIKYVRFRLNG